MSPWQSCVRYRCVAGEEAALFGGYLMQLVIFNEAGIKGMGLTKVGIDTLII